MEAAAVSLTGVPLAQGGALRVDVVGREREDLYIPNWDLISPGYFDVFGIRLIRGGSSATAIGAVRFQWVINETMGRQLWPGADPGSTGSRWPGCGPCVRRAGPKADRRDHQRRAAVWLVPPAASRHSAVPLAQMAEAQMALFNRLSVPATCGPCAFGRPRSCRQPCWSAGSWPGPGSRRRGRGPWTSVRCFHGADRAEYVAHQRNRYHVAARRRAGRVHHRGVFSPAPDT